MPDTIIAYHFLRADMASPHRPHTKWAVGQKRTLRGGDIIPCIRGYHGSPTSFDAVQYATGPILCKVWLSGNVQTHGDPVDKYVARTRKLLAAVDVSRELRMFAADCAERVLPIFEGLRPADKRPRAAIQAARDYANGLIDAEELGRARADASAAYSAASVINTIYTYVDASAAYSVHASAAYSAYSACGAAESDAAAGAANTTICALTAARINGDDNERAWQRERWDYYTAHIFGDAK